MQPLSRYVLTRCILLACALLASALVVLVWAGEPSLDNVRLLRRAGPGHGPGCAGNRVDRFGTAGGYFDT